MHNSRLFEPLTIGTCELSNRLVMAPLTRLRASDSHVPGRVMVEYYSQRACIPGTLLITEATFISREASGYDNVPGIWSEEQIEGWKHVVRAVHDKGSFIYCQLWALGRTATPDVMKRHGLHVVSSSATTMPVKAGQRTKNPAEPEELGEEAIWKYVTMYADAAKNAIKAGFDGVEIHAANGYLIDQFNQDTCNKRTDAWGGSVEKRSRFAVEVSKAVVRAIGPNRTGIRLSPFSTFQGMKMKDPIPQFTDLAQRLRELKLAYLHLVESRISGNADIEATEKIDFLVNLWSAGSDPTPALLAGGFKADSAKRAVDEEYADKDVAIVFGRLFISNPDLVFRLKKGIELTKYDRDTFYAVGSEKGYVDYDFSNEFKNMLVEAK